MIRRKPAEERRDYSATTKLSKVEMRAVTNKASVENRSISDWIRITLLNAVAKKSKSS